MDALTNLTASLILCFLASRLWRLPYYYRQQPAPLAAVHIAGLFSVLFMLWALRSGSGLFGKHEVLFPLAAQMFWFIHDSALAMLLAPLRTE